MGSKARRPLLKPCPFCGGEAELDLMDMCKYDEIWVFCTSCGNKTDDYKIEAEAIAAWNRREEAGE